MDFNEDIEACLDALEHGRLIGFPTPAGWMLGADATRESVASDLLEKCGLPASQPAILLADERDFLQHISALDLSIFDQAQELTMPAAGRFEGVLGIAENLLQPDGSVLFSLVQDSFALHLIKRFRQPIGVIPCPQDRLTKKAFFVAGDHCPIAQQGFSIYNFA